MDPNINKQTNINHEFELIPNTSISNNDFLSSDNIINNQNPFQLALQQNDLPKMSSFSLTKPLKTFANCIYFNYFPSTTSTKLNPYTLTTFKSTLPLYLFNTKYSEDEDLPNGFVSHNDINKLHKRFINELSKLILFTYRTNIKTPNKIFNTDCGWGCTIRACQMLIAKGIIDYKIHQCGLNIINNSSSSSSVQEQITSIIKETLLLFYDNDIPIHYCKNNRDFQYMLSTLNNNETTVTPPFSIKNICAVTNCYNKFIASQSVIEAFNDISKQYLSNSMQFIQVESTDISQQYLHSCFFNDSNSNTCRMGIIFITFRFNYITNHHEPSITYIRRLFTHIHNNIGFISGSTNRAYYFIGTCTTTNDLLYLDPHFTHKALFSNFTSDTSSYTVKSLYKINSKHIAPHIQLGILIKNENDYLTLISNIEELSKCCDFIHLSK